jgi:predicted esterase
MWQQYADQEQFILLCPTLSGPDGGWYQADGERKLFAVLDEVTQTLQIEPVYFLAGFSAGAQFVQGVAFAYPDSVTGAAVLSAGNYMPLDTAAQAVPFQVIIGDGDNPEAVTASQQFVSTMEENQFSVEYYVLPGVGHEVTDEARQLTIDFFRWVYGK